MGQVDYAALAAQARQSAPVDYAALAEQARAQPAPAAQPEAPMRGMLPTAGGLVGSLVGAPFGQPVAGAAAGGALGKGAEMLLDSTPQSFSEGAQEMGKAGAEQGAYELAGGLVGKGLAKGAGRLYQSVAKPAKALRAEFPTVIQDALRSGVALGQRGADKAERLLSQAGAATRDMLSTAEAAGVKPITMRPVLKSLSSVEEKVSKQPLRDVDLSTLRNIRGQVLAENPAPIPITAAQDMKQAAQRIASEGYRKIDRGGDINSVPLDANMAIASGLRQAIERRAPEVGPLNQQTQKLIGVRKMVDAANDRVANHAPPGLGMSALIASGAAGAAGLASGDRNTGIGTGLSVMALTNPAIASRLAIGANRLAPLASHAPQAGRLAALLSQLGQR